MGLYRPSRNLEASTIERIETILRENHYSNVTVEKTFSRVYNTTLNPDEGNAIICIRCGDTDHDRIEIGSNSTTRKPLILIDLFCTSDGQRLDLKDLLISELKNGYDYYGYTIDNGKVQERDLKGRIIVTIADTPINFGITDKTTLDIHDKYRHLISLDTELNLIEE